MADTPSGTSEESFADLVRAALSERGEPHGKLEFMNTVTDAALAQSGLLFQNVPDSVEAFEVQLSESSENRAALCPRYTHLHFERHRCLQGTVGATILVVVPVPPQRGRFTELFPAALRNALGTLVDATPGVRAQPDAGDEPFVHRDPGTRVMSVWHSLSCDLALGPFAPDDPISLACTHAAWLLESLYQAAEYLVMRAGAALQPDAEVRDIVREIVRSGPPPRSAPDAS